MNIPFPRNTNFVGRESELQTLHDALTGSDAAQVGISPAGLIGMGGIGKTQLAVEYAYRYADHYAGGIYWINAANSLRGEFIALGQMLLGVTAAISWQGRLTQLLVKHFNVEELQTLCFELAIHHDEFEPKRSPLARELVAHCERHERLPQLVGLARQKQPDVAWPVAASPAPGGGRSQDDLIAVVFNHLQSHPHALLILDNLAEPLTLNQPLTGDLIPANLTNPMLFTTRSRELGDFRPLVLNVLPEAAALELLLTHPRRQPVLAAAHAEHETARQICASLGYLPLAVEVAGKHLGKKTATKLAVYQRTLHKRGALSVIESEKLPVETAHERGLQAVLADQWDMLPSEEARTLLRVAGQLPEAALIPTARLGLLAGIADEGADDFFEETTLSEALRQLADVSLVEMLRGERVRLHPLVRAFAAQNLPEVPNLREAAFRLWCAGNMADAYEDFAILEDHCARRGIDALQEDLLAALDLTASHQPPVPSPQQPTTSPQPPIPDRLQTLLRLLQREVHNLRGWDRHSRPAAFAQQMAFRAWDLGLKRMAGAAAKLAGELTQRLTPRWRARNESLNLERTLTDHMGAVNGVAITPDGQRAVSASSDQTLKVWNLQTGAEERTLSGHSDWVRAVAITPDGQRAVSASSDQTLKVWNLQTGAEERTLSGHSALVLAVAITPDGQRAVSASSDQTLKVWNLQTGAEERTLSGHSDWVRAVAITPDGQRAVSASSDQTLKVWNLQTGAEERTLSGHSAWVLAVAITPDGQRAVSASDDQTLKVWNLQTGAEERTLSGHSDWVRAVAITPDGQRAVSASDDQTLKVWNLQTGAEERTLSGHSDWVRAVAITPDGQRAVSASSDQTLKVWNLQTGAEERTLSGHSALVLAVAITPDGQRAVSASSDQTLKVWNLQTGAEERTLSGHSDWVRAVAITPDGQRAVSASSDQTLKVWNLQTGAEERTLSGHSAWVLAVAITPDGQRAVSASSDQTLKVWNLQTGAEERTLSGHSDWVRAVAITPDGQRAVSASSDQTLKVWNLQTGAEERTLSGHSDWVRAVAITPDGQRAVSASSDQTLKVWNLQTGAEERTLSGHSDWVLAVAITPDGQRAVSASDDQTLKVWNLQTGKEIVSVTLDGSLQCVAVAPDGVTLVTGDAAGNVYCLRLAEPPPT